MNGLSRLYSARIWAATASLTGLSPKHRLDRVARQREHQGVHQKRRAENHRDHLQNASQKILAHWFLLLITHSFASRLRLLP